MHASAQSEPIRFPFEFSPQPEQDSDLLRYIGFVPGVKELLVTRQVHALEHATVQVLSKLQRTQHPLHTSPNRLNVSGVSNAHGFYIYGDVDTVSLHQAVRVALRRLTHGDWHLAIHPQCGTNNSVNWLMASGLSFFGINGSSINASMPNSMAGLLIDADLSAEVLPHIFSQLGTLLQTYVTTAIPFNLVIENIQVLSSSPPSTHHFVTVRWIEPSSVSASLLD